jgi:hypothetical protein
MFDSILSPRNEGPKFEVVHDFANKIEQIMTQPRQAITRDLCSFRKDVAEGCLTRGDEDITTKSLLETQLHEDRHENFHTVNETQGNLVQINYLGWTSKTHLSLGMNF